jgi:RNA polymerase sigma factor (sigma-70 family)
MGLIEKWIRRVRHKSDSNAANDLVSIHYKEIYSYVYRQTLNKELALDLTQDIFMNMLQSIDSFDARKASFRTWLYRLATFRIVDYYRSKSYKYQIITEQFYEEELLDPEDFTIHLEYKQDVERIIKQVNLLDTFSQQIFRLKLFADYTFIEIAALLDIPESTVKTKYYSMIKKIKNSLEAENHG